MTRPSGVVTLLTDFGARDPYVGIVKGVLLREHAALTLVDLCHEVPPQAVEVAAFWIARSVPYFAPGTVHLCVVDPGVGSARAAIAAEVAGHTFVAPDNGLLSEVIAQSDDARVRRIDALSLGLDVPSRTFHARDLFAPVAARLASGKLAFVELGPVHEPRLERRSLPARDASGVNGRVLFVDHFGNAVTDIPEALVDASTDEVSVGAERLRLVQTYAEAEPLECVGLVSSFGTLEIARRDGSAAAALGLVRGVGVKLVRRGAAA